MCRFVYYMGKPVTMASLITEPANSLIHQSYAARERFEPLNGDGFGVAWYAPEIDDRPALFKSVTPAWNNRNLHQLARVTRSHCFLAHVRAATSAQSVDEVNCHPFTWKQYAFAHNGDVGAFRRVRRRLLEGLSDEAYNLIHGSTDSEHAFALFVDHLQKTEEPDYKERMARALRNTIGDLVRLSREADPEAHSYMNFVVTDGRRAVISHVSTNPAYIDSLHLHAGGRYSHEGEKTRILPRHSGDTDAITVSSEVLNDAPGWHTLGVNRLLVIDEDLSARSRELRIDGVAPVDAPVAAG